MGKPVILRIREVYYPVIAAVSLPVNLVAILIMSQGKCGLSKCITRYLVGMAAADLLAVFTDVIIRRIARIYFGNSFLLITPVCSLTVVLLSASTIVSVWLTLAFTFDRFVAICCDKLKTKYCSERTAAVVIGTVSVLGCLLSVPWYFIYKPKVFMAGVPWHCLVKPEFFTSVTWAAFNVTDRILPPCVPFCLILMFNILTVRRILEASRVHRGLLGHSTAKHEKDPEMENRRKSMVLLFSIAGSFLLLWVTTVAFQIYRQTANIYIDYSYNDPNYITEQTAYMLQFLNTCTNTLIYAVTQRKFREELWNGVKYPLRLVLKLIK